MWADPNVTRFIGGRPSTRAQTWSRLLTYIGHWTALDFGYWAIEDRSTGNFVGEIGFADFKREISPSMQDVPEIGFALCSGVHGRGYGAEALEAVLSWGDAHLASTRSVALVNADNHASLHILERAGYRIFDRAQYGGSAVMYLERRKPAPIA
jgi:RimJ/RimL family protein N-acetyltransferase